MFTEVEVDSSGCLLSCKVRTLFISYISWSIARWLPPFPLHPPAPRLSFPSHLSTTLSHFIPWGRVAVEVEWTIEIYYLSSQDNNWDVFGNQHLNVKSPRLLYILEVWVAFDLQSVKTRSSFRRKTVTNNINLLTKFSSHRG